MCYTKIVTKKNKKYKRYNIYKEDTKMAVVKLTTDNFEQEVIQRNSRYSLISMQTGADRVK